MIKITVKTFAVIREYLGSSTVDLGLADGSVVYDAIVQLSRRNPLLEQELLLNGGVNSSLTFIINNKKIPHEQLREYVLQDNDTLVILPPTGGG